MRAANLMPGDDRVARAAKAVDAGGAAYIVLAALGALVALVAVLVTTNKQIGESRARLDRVNAEQQVATARLSRAAPYEAFAALARDRVATVTSLSSTRFDWAHGLREISRVLPDDVWLTSLTGTSGAGEASPAPTTSAAPAPTFELLGCTGDQAKVARLMARLRAIDGVREVALRTSSKPDGPGSRDCPANATSNPTFSITIAFAVPGASKAAVDATGAILDPSAGSSSAPAGGSAASTGDSSAPAAGSGPASSPTPAESPSSASDSSIR